MKKIILSACLFISLFVLGTKAQAQMAIGANGSLALPMGDLGKSVDMGFGGGASGHYFVSPKFSVGVNVSFATFKPKAVNGVTVDGSTSILGIAPSVNYYFSSEGFRPYIGTDLGYYIASAKVTVLGQSISDSKGYFGIAPTLGFLYGFSDNLSLNVNAKYNMIFSEGTSTSLIPINLGILYTFGGKK